jgi:hypothetical protein
MHRYHARPKEELYRIEEDPSEENNLAYDPRYADTLASMRKLIQDRMHEVKDDRSLSGDPWLLKDHPLPPAIQLYYPNGGETLQPDHTTNIAWSNFWTGTQTVKLEYNDGRNWKIITASTPHNGSFAWRVPAIASNSVRLRISSADGNTFDESDRTFSISPKQ